jgi:catechol 2,3-dioxygenase
MTHYGVPTRDDGRTLSFEDPWANAIRVATEAPTAA